jgi:hypothetical protein
VEKPFERARGFYTTPYELQPKFSVMESSIRDIFIFWKLSCLEEDNALFKKLMPWSYILNIDRGPYGPIAVFEIS